MPRKTPDTSIAVYGAGGGSYLELVRRFPLRPIRTEEELDAATVVIHSLIDKEVLTPPEDDYLDVLSDLVIAYEEVHYPESR